MYTNPVNRILFLMVVALTVATVAFAQNGKAEDRLGLSAPFQFDNSTYLLKWSSHPSADLYKQEYLTKGELPESYKKMILVDVSTTPQHISVVVGHKVEELKKLKALNPLHNYEVIQNQKTGEYIIDFLLTAAGENGDISIAERNVYRYKTVTDKNGRKAVMLFGVSTRAYGKSVNEFFISIKNNRRLLINTLANYNLPEIGIRS